MSNNACHRKEMLADPKYKAWYDELNDKLKLDIRAQMVLAEIGENMCAARKKKHISLSVLSRRADIAQHTIRHIELGKTSGNLQTIVRLAMALGIGIDEYVGYPSPTEGASVTPLRARWINRDFYDENGEIVTTQTVCSNCAGLCPAFGRKLYCPECGAKMDFVD